MTVEEAKEQLKKTKSSKRKRDLMKFIRRTTMANQEQTGNGCAIAGLATTFIGIFLMGGIMGIASIILGILALKGSAWAKVLGVLEIIVGVIFVVVMMLYVSMM